ncbi:Dynein Heavy Chain Domain-Containing Protein 1 [Manis pentadactyla]|nr:Dynein Heavy Chain Domain-Containing Protein 1 [Manis pentadactyla]
MPSLLFHKKGGRHHPDWRNMHLSDGNILLEDPKIGWTQSSVSCVVISEQLEKIRRRQHLFVRLPGRWGSISFPSLDRGSGCPASARKTPPGVDKYLWMRASSCYRRDVHAQGLRDVERQMPSAAAVATLSSSLEQLHQDLQWLPGQFPTWHDVTLSLQTVLRISHVQADLGLSGCLKACGWNGNSDGRIFWTVSALGRALSRFDE